MIGFIFYIINHLLEDFIPNLIDGLFRIFRTMVCCSKEEAEPEVDIISYKIVNNSDLEPTVLIEYTDENGTNTNVNNPTLPWEVSYKSNFTKPQLLKHNASCDCEMTAQILHNGKVVNDSTNYRISIDYSYQ